LAVIFLVLLLLIIGIRFEPESLVRSKVIELASISGVKLQFGEVNVRGWYIDFSNVSATSGKTLQSLSFEKVELSPAWSSLFRGDAAVNLELIWQGLAGTSLVSQSGRYILLRDIHVQAEMGELLKVVEPYIHLPFPVQASGNVNLKGEVLLDSVSGMPDSGALNLHWQGAKAGAMGVEVALGDLSLQLQSEAAQWNWLIDDAGIGFVHAGGAVRKQGMRPENWPIHGSGVINIAKLNDPSLLAWLPDGNAGEMRFNVSGVVLNPRVDIVK
jgi:hypothetical protein